MPWRLFRAESEVHRRLLLCLAILTSILASAGTFTGVYAILKISGQVNANCEVLSVLLTTRADRDKSIELFQPIRKQNPKQFDALVKRAEDGDARLRTVQGKLACDVSPE